MSFHPEGKKISVADMDTKQRNRKGNRITHTLLGNKKTSQAIKKIILFTGYISKFSPSKGGREIETY